MTFNIYGCCVSREPIEALMRKRDDVSVNQYVAFINPIALCSEKNTRKINIDELNDIQTSNFRKRNLCLDINGSAFDYLFAKESDYIVIDTWDFRQPMIEKDGCYITIDPTTIKRNEQLNEKFGWSDHNHIFHYQITDAQYDAAIDELCGRVLQHYKPEQIILMDSYGVQNYFDEKKHTINFYKQIDLDALEKVNARAKANFERLYKNFGNCHIIEFPKNNKVYGASDAKWGIMFLHYWNLYYDYAADAINIAVMGLSKNEESERMDELKSKYEYNADAKTSGAIIMPRIENIQTRTEDNGEVSKMNHTELIEKMLNTRDFKLYLQCLQMLQDDYLIAVSTRHTPGSKMPDDILDKIHTLGFTGLSRTHLMMYSGVVSRGKTLFDKCADNGMIPVEFSGMVDGQEISIISRSWDGGLLSSIKINEEEYSLNGRGINIVVYDLECRVVIDSCNYDAYTNKPTFFHKNLFFNEEYFNNHFFVREKYRDIWYAPYKKKYFSDRVLDIKEIENGLILPNKVIGNAVYGGVCSDKFEFVSGCYTTLPDINRGSRHIVGSYMVSDNELQYVDEVVVYGGTLMNHPGHLLCEAFADRIWCYIKSPDINAKVAVVCIWGDDTHRFQIEFLKQFGFKDEDIIFVDRPIKFKKVIVPDQSEYPYRTSCLEPYEYTKETVSVIERLKQKAPEASYRKIYFTKTKTQKGNIIGEDFFINFFKNKGFQIINPEDYSLNEKIGFLKSADEFAALFGSNTCYAVFCKPTTRVTVLSRNTGSLMETQSMLNEMAGIKECFCVDTSLNIFNANLTYGLTFVGVTECFRNYVKYYFNEDLDVTTNDFMKMYFYEYLIKVPQYYSNPQYFNFIKNQKMLDVIQNISEYCLNMEFDISGLDISTEEDKLNEKVKRLTDNDSVLKNRIAELENTDINKVAVAFKTINDRFEKQICDLQNMLQKNIDQQAKIDVLTSQKNELEKTLVKVNNTMEVQSEKIKNMQAQVSELEICISNIMQSSSWKITKPLRAILQKFGKENQP